MGLDGPDVHGALALGRVEQGGLGCFQSHGHQVEVAIADHTLACEGLKVVDLDFDPALFQPHAQVLAGAVGQDEEQATGLPGAHEHGHGHGVARVVVQGE